VVDDTRDPAVALLALDELTRRLRAECPWDREQDERSIVPHTVEEAYELADAAFSGDDAKLLDELGDVLFQVHFLSLLLEERGAGSLADVADHCRQKLIRRHPHVFSDVEVAGEGGVHPVGPKGSRPDVPRARTSDEVLANWDEIKQGEEGREPGIFGEVPENLPALLYARKLQRRAKSAGVEVVVPEPSGPAEDEIGDRLFALVDEARRQKIDPELALRRAGDRFRARVQSDEEQQ
jgi:XTP/dITP diphosphohydrolase/tetrapyrrole methylase family protein/MazG family protein/ATP diphosphatase